MTNEEIKGRLESFIDTFNICKEHDNALVAVSISKEDIQAFTQAIAALEQEPCEDAISRQAVKDIICSGVSIDTDADKEYVCELIDKLPSVTPKEKTGKWITEDMFGGDETYYRCSECNELFWIEGGTPKDNEYNFCPNCGARMEGE